MGERDEQSRSSPSKGSKTESEITMKRKLCLLLTLAFLVVGCASEMESENAQTIKLEVRGSGPVEGTLQADTPGMAGLSTNNFKFDAPGNFEVKGGPSGYSITFHKIPSASVKDWTLTVDGRELKRGPDIIVEDDKGPRLTFTVGVKKPAATATP